MAHLGVLAQIEKERTRELIDRAEHGGYEGLHDEEHYPRMKKYKLSVKRKGAGALLKEALGQGADKEDLQMLRHIKFVADNS